MSQFRNAQAETWYSFTVLAEQASDGAPLHERIGPDIAQPSPTRLGEDPPHPRHAVVDVLPVQPSALKVGLVLVDQVGQATPRPPSEPPSAR